MQPRSPEKSVGVVDVKVLKLDEKVTTLHFLAIDVELTVLAPNKHLPRSTWRCQRSM